MLYKFYYGKIGRVFNVIKYVVGVIINKRVRWVYENEIFFVFCLWIFVIIVFFIGDCELWFVIILIF